MLGSLRVTFTALMLLASFVLLLAVARKYRQCKESPIPLVLNLSFIGFVLGLLLMTASVWDWVSPGSLLTSPCLWMLYIIMGVLNAFKAATLCLAVDQFSAVASPLRHRDRMARWLPGMVAATWAAPLSSGLAAAALHQALQPETVQQYNRRVFGLQHEAAECRWERAAHLFIVAEEVWLLALSLASGSLFVFTAVVGLRRQRRINRAAVPGDAELNQVAVRHFKSFKRIIKVLALVTLLDVVGAALRIVSRWHQLPEAFHYMYVVRIPGLVIECWTYGLSHSGLRAAVVDFFGRMRSAVEPLPTTECVRAVGGHTVPCRGESEPPEPEPEPEARSEHT
ncbi:hypothetical protein FJT64_013117 [Amphibalanus amphitrite]|uniref:G-protein coupled receptors family 1 profile domain-containing protein n=1 Tax=Amphibalanus amphitrite TaxID=1232801 RepID=A0A6A4V5R9_AMPAM|nr:hypothetical protein FJT64_013117 [Amphibalanus amphitrite]